MKKLFLILGIIGVLACLTRLRAAEDAKEFYRDFEFQIDAFGELKTPDLDTERSAAGFGVNIFLTRNLGIGVSTVLEDLRGSAIDSVSLKGIFRAPINHYAFYAFAGGTRQLNHGEWTIQAGPGFEWRWTPNVGTYTEINFDKRLTGDREITAQARLGLRVSF